MKQTDFTVIDSHGYRANIAIALLNRQNQLFWGKRIGQSSWQFPQGGVKKNETALAAMYRELHEETGLNPQDVNVIASTPEWLHYDLPKKYIRNSTPLCIGQKQKWFLLRLISDESEINLQASDIPEFDQWRWIDYTQPTQKVIDFKRDVYQQALTYLKQFIPQH